MPNFTLEVKGNGSAFRVTDSKAIARVEAESLIKTGALFGFAPYAEPGLPTTIAKAVQAKIAKKRCKKEGGRLNFIGWLSPTQVSAKNVTTVNGNLMRLIPIGLVEGPPGQ
jgi:hypothetical protein